MTKLHKKLRKWLKKKREDIPLGKWQITQYDKKTKRLYKVGSVVDFVYAYDSREYVHYIARIKAAPGKRSVWGGRGFVYKIAYETVEGKKRGGETKRRLSYGQRPVVTSERVFRKLMRDAKKKKFFK